MKKKKERKLHFFLPDGASEWNRQKNPEMGLKKKNKRKKRGGLLEVGRSQKKDLT